MKTTELLSQLVSRPSPSGDEGPLASFIEELARAGGLDVQRLGNSLIASTGGPGPELLYLSHLDTVPPGDFGSDPYDPTWRDDRLTARGANDAKISVACMLAAALRHRREGLGAGRLTVAFAACEETNNSGAAAILAALGERPDAAVVGEPTGLAVIRAQAGLAVLEAEWTGRSCHAAHVARVEHENALVLAARAAARFGSFALLPGEHALLGASTIALTQLASGERHNVVPDRARAVFDARLAPPHDAAAARRFLAGALPDARVTVRSDRLRPYEVDASHPLVVAALAQSGEPAALGSNTLSDMALLGDLPAVKCGPGQTVRSHTPGEFVLRAEVEAGERFYFELAPRVLSLLARTEVSS